MIEHQGNPTSAEIDVVMAEVRAELVRAIAAFGPIYSPHEGHSVIWEEFDELWDEVKANRGRETSARREATQIAAMAVRYILDLHAGETLARNIDAPIDLTPG